MLDVVKDKPYYCTCGFSYLFKQKLPYNYNLQAGQNIIKNHHHFLYLKPRPSSHHGCQTISTYIMYCLFHIDRITWIQTLRDVGLKKLSYEVDHRSPTIRYY